uniref:Uncharacterized protein n=1 Tax=Lepeophtheirus salmonis TaxID=72036 RepID=A0A0K2VH20_LEPSM
MRGAVDILSQDAPSCNFQGVEVMAGGEPHEGTTEISHIVAAEVLVLFAVWGCNGVLDIVGSPDGDDNGICSILGTEEIAHAVSFLLLLRHVYTSKEY